MEQLSLWATITEPMCCNQRVRVPQGKTPHDATKIGCSQIKKYFLKKWMEALKSYSWALLQNQVRCWNYDFFTLLSQNFKWYTLPLHQMCCIRKSQTCVSDRTYRKPRGLTAPTQRTLSHPPFCRGMRAWDGKPGLFRQSLQFSISLCFCKWVRKWGE